MEIFCTGGNKTLWEIGENAGYQHFLPFSYNVFFKALFLVIIERLDCYVKDSINKITFSVFSVSASNITWAVSVTASGSVLIASPVPWSIKEKCLFLCIVWNARKEEYFDNIVGVSTPVSVFMELH